jgi:hypothetical protein
VADFPGAPLYGSSGWPFASAPDPYVAEPIDSVPGRLAIVLGGAESPGPAPVIEWLDPAPGTPITRDAAITVRVTDSDLVLTVLSALYASLGLEEVVFRAGAFGPRYRASSLTQEGSVRTFVLRRSGGWPASVRFAVDAVDASGQVGAD